MNPDHLKTIQRLKENVSKSRLARHQANTLAEQLRINTERAVSTVQKMKEDGLIDRD